MGIGQQASHTTRRSESYCFALVGWVLTLLFTLRIAGQALQSWSPQAFLPSADNFQGSALPYGLLLTVQLLILVVMVRTNVRIRSGVLVPRRRLGAWLASAGTLYMAIALGRIAVGLLVPDAHVWFRTWIPAFFHVVLAGYVLMAACYHLYGPPSGRSE